MKRNDPTFQEMVSRLTTGELTRKQAAEIYGLNPSTLDVWLSRSGITRATTSKAPRVRRGAELGWNVLSDDLVAEMDAAIARILAGESSALGESKKNPRLNLGTLTVKARAARKLAGLPQARMGRAPKAKPDVEAPVALPHESSEVMAGAVGFKVEFR